MKIYYREKSGGIEILRCFGIESRVEIPGMIDGKLVISAAPYAFSSHMDEKEELKNASLWEVSDGLGFGREEHVLAGNDVEEIVFPDTLKEIGRYIFYGCGNLRKLEFSDSLMQIGCGAFTGCHALEKLTVHMRQGKKSGVKEMLGEMWQRIDVNFFYEYEEDGIEKSDIMHRRENKSEARLVFPEHYDEAVENTPARILYTEYHGSGSNYRQCFYDRELNYQEYDRLFEMAVAMDRQARCARARGSVQTERAPSGRCLRPAAGRPAHGCGGAGLRAPGARSGCAGRPPCTGSRNRTARGPSCAPRRCSCPGSACRWAECPKECVYVFLLPL